MIRSFCPDLRLQMCRKICCTQLLQLNILQQHFDFSLLSQIPIATYFYSLASQKLNIKKNYKDKATLQHDIPKGVANLQLRGVISTDTRAYECKAEIMDDEDGSQADTANLVVLGKDASLFSETKHFRDNYIWLFFKDDVKPVFGTG